MPTYKESVLYCNLFFSVLRKCVCKLLIAKAVTADKEVVDIINFLSARVFSRKQRGKALTLWNLDFMINSLHGVE